MVQFGSWLSTRVGSAGGKGCRHLPRRAGAGQAIRVRWLYFTRFAPQDVPASRSIPGGAVRRVDGSGRRHAKTTTTPFAGRRYGDHHRRVQPPGVVPWSALRCVNSWTRPRLLPARHHLGDLYQPLLDHGRMLRRGSKRTACLRLRAERQTRKTLSPHEVACGDGGLRFWLYFNNASIHGPTKCPLS